MFKKSQSKTRKLLFIHQHDGTAKYISLVNNKGEILKTLMNYPNLPYINLFPIGSFLTQTKETRITLRFDNSIYSLNKRQLTKELSIDFNEYQLPEHLIKSDTSAENLEQACESNQYISSIFNVIECDSLFLFKTNLTGTFIYNRKEETLNKYQFLNDRKRKMSYDGLIPIDGKSDKVAFASATSRMNADYQIDKDKIGTPKGSFVEEFKQVKKEDNPVLIIQQLK